MSNSTMASCFCVGRQQGCTCGKCRCACTCGLIKDKDFSEFSAWVDKIDAADKIDESVTVGKHVTVHKNGARTVDVDSMLRDPKVKEEIAAVADWMTEVDPYEGQAVHKTRKGKGAVGQAISKSKRLPNCS